MKTVEQNIASAPNQVHHGDRRANTYVSLAGGINPFHSARFVSATDHSGDSSSTSFMASPVLAPDHRFHVDTVGMRADRCARDPGHGAIPVELGSANQVIVDDADLIHISRS